MRVVLFFVFLCFLVMKGGQRVHAGMHRSGICYALAEHKQKTQPPHLSDFKLCCSAGTITVIAKESEFLLVDCIEEEEDDLSGRKFILQARQHSTFSYQSVLNYLCNSFKAPPSFGGPVADKYILQRVLRV